MFYLKICKKIILYSANYNLRGEAVEKWRHNFTNWFIWLEIVRLKFLFPFTGLIHRAVKIFFLLKMSKYFLSLSHGFIKAN